MGSLRTGAAWSTIKLPIAVRELHDGAEGDDTAQIRSALTASDNAAAAVLWARLSARHGGASGAAAAVEAVLAQGGDRVTQVSTQGRESFSPYGQTAWSLRSAERFMAGLAGGCTDDPDAAKEALGLMSEVIESQSWGLGSAGRPARFKGGWGPGSDGRYLVRQLGVVEYSGGSEAVAVAIAAQPGSFAAGTSALTSLARWIAKHVDARAVRAGHC